MRTLGYCFATLVALGSTTTSYADVIYGSEPSTPSNQLMYADRRFGQAAADDFSLDPGQNTIGEIHFYGGYYLGDPTSADDFRIEVYSDRSRPGPPDPPPYNTLDEHVATATIRNVERTSTPYVSTGTPVPLYKYTVAIDPLTLPADTTFWLAISNETSSLNWGITGATLGYYDGNGHYYSASRGRWFPYQGDGSWPDGQTSGAINFWMTDVVHEIPEPSSAVLFVLGIAGLWGWRRR